MVYSRLKGVHARLPWDIQFLCGAIDGGLGFLTGDVLLWKKQGCVKLETFPSHLMHYCTRARGRQPTQYMYSRVTE